MEFETVIGLEVHVQLQTKSKIFCGASAAFGAGPNEHVDPVTFALPGSLPVLNRRVVECAVALGLATHCQIRSVNRFARKHYFYPDLPKGYQISQFDEPICEHGHVKLFIEESVRTIGIKRIHMEEDAGKNIHDPKSGSSLLDLNRAGVPLLEIVSEPDLRSADEAAAYLRTIRQIVRYLGISDGNMDEGSLRCDANVSLRPMGEMKYGTRTEIKNMNSFRFVEHAIDYEVARQASLLKSGAAIVQETRLFDSETGATVAMRSKEESSDYRYFPDPDLPPVIVEESWIQSVRASLPRLPEDCRRELVEGYGLSSYDAAVLTAEPEIFHFFQEVHGVCSNAKDASNWITSELFGQLNKAGIGISESPVSGKSLGRLIEMVQTDAISGKMAKGVFEEMFKSGRTPDEIVQEKGLKQITDEGAILKVVQAVFDQHPNQLKDYLSGKDKVHGFFVGQIMKETKGSANPKMVNELIKKELERRKT